MAHDSLGLVIVRMFAVLYFVVHFTLYSVQYYLYGNW